MSMRSALGQVRGLGSAKEGTGHWWAQRLTTLALIPLTVWFVTSVVAMAGADYYAMRDWIASPVVAGLLVLLIVAVFHHMQLSFQVVIEDYVHHEGAKLVLLLGIKAGAIVLGLAGLLSVLKIFVEG